MRRRTPRRRRPRAPGVDSSELPPLVSSGNEAPIRILTAHSALPPGLAALLITASAVADERRLIGEPNVLSEPGEISQVVDAFDEHDLFDVHLSLGFQYSRKRANILRETSIVKPGLATGLYTPSTLNVAQFSETTSRLSTRADIGLYRDIALVIRMPIILSNKRGLSSLEGSAGQQALILEGAPGEQLFGLPFESPKRSGIEYLALGLDAAILNQARDPSKPTWVIGVEGRFNVSKPMRACNAQPKQLNPSAASTQVDCADPSDVDRDGVGEEPIGGDEDLREGRFSGSRDPGVSRGVTALELHTSFAKRIKYIEPYGGIRALFEFPNASSEYGALDLEGSLVNHPPVRGTFLLGLNVFPWEIREQFQRITLDFRFTGTYVSEGRDYSELFDALGSSDAPTLRSPHFARYHSDASGASVVDPSSRRVYMSGLTDVQQHLLYGLSAAFTWQAGEYVKFNAGGAFTVTQAHFITFDQPCNPDFSGDPGRAGPCRSRDGDDRVTGMANPNFRKTLNDPGHRFKVDTATQFDAWVNATVMF